LTGSPLAFVARVIRPVHFTPAELPLIQDRVKEIARTRANLRLPSTRGSDDPRHRPNFFTAPQGGGLTAGLLSIGPSGLNCSNTLS